MTHRVLFSRLPSLLAIPFLLTLGPAVSAQDTTRKTVSQPQVAAVPMATPSAKNKETSATAKARIEQKKALGTSLLVSLANDARNYQDQKLRARTLSRIADALWEPDPEQGRALFRKAWDAADAADQETARKLNEERQRQQGNNPDGPVAFGGGPDLRAEVLRLAAKRDRALGEELLDKLKEARKQEATDATSPGLANALDTPAAIKQRLRLAGQLLQSEVGRWLQVAAPALGTVTMEGVDFLSFLRDKNPVAADQRYAR